MAGEKKNGKKNGNAHMQSQGKKPIMIWVTPEQMERIQEAAQVEVRKVAQFVLASTIHAAEAVLAKARRAKGGKGPAKEG